MMVVALSVFMLAFFVCMLIKLAVVTFVYTMMLVVVICVIGLAFFEHRSKQ